MRAGLAFEPRPSDVIISPFPKSGTTWLQQIVHGLRTRGDMDFDDISRVIPWIKTAHDLGLDLEEPQGAAPRAYKSHLGWQEVPKGGRYIVVFRDPKDILVSLYRFLEGWLFEPGSISIASWARQQFIGNRDPGRPGYWGHLSSWWEARNEENILLLCYEDMLGDLPDCVTAIAAFAGIELDDELLDLVVRQSTIDFMLAHKSKFDEPLMRALSERVAGIPPGSDASKVRIGKVGTHRSELPGEISDEMDEVWQAQVTPKLGFPSYQHFREAVRSPST